MVTVTGRVMSIRVAEDSSGYSVMLGPLPNLVAFRSRARVPPRLGQRITVRGTEASKQAMGDGSLTELSSANFAIDVNTPAVRVIPAAWLDRAKSAMLRPLYDYQVTGAAWLCARLTAGTGAILADEPGTGKSAQTVAALCVTRPFPVVIVCPASLKLHWEREFHWAKHPPTVCVVHGTKVPLPPRAEIYVANYDILASREAEIQALNPQLFIFDEAHELKHPTASGKHRAAVATRLVSHTPTGAILLTGTPLMNRPNELWRLLHLAEPKSWPKFADFQARYLQGKKGKEVGRSVRNKAGKVERLTELQAAVDTLMLRRLKAHVLKDLPPKSRRSVLVELDEHSMKHYQTANKDVAAWLRALGHFERASNADKNAVLVKFTMLRRIAAIGKARSVIPSYLQEWFSGGERRPLVIFGYHKDVMLSLWQTCRRMGLRAAGIGGGESVEKRQRQVDAFQAGKADVFLAPIKSAGVGLNLQRASEALFIERIFTPSGMLQAEDRIHRIGQDRPVTITYLDAAGTVDEHLADIIETKQSLIRTVVDHGDELSESMETVRQLADQWRH